MAKRKINKSEMIREYAGANPEASAMDIVNYLAKKNLVVSAQTVATVKSKAGLTRKKRRKGKRNVQSSGTQMVGDGFASQTLVAAKQLLANAGSSERAIEAVRLIQKLESIGA